MGKNKRIYPKQKNLFLYSETWLIILSTLLLTSTTILVYLFLLEYLKLPFAWLLLTFTIFITRKSYAFKMGLAFYNLASFLLGYIFGIWLAVLAILVSLATVAKIRPDQIQGLIVNFVLLTIVAGASSITSSVYGLDITKTQFLTIAILIVALGITIDFLFAAKFTGAAKPRLLFSHCLELFVNYYIIMNFGYMIFKFLVGLT